MHQQLSEVARACLHGAESDELSFPEIVGRLSEAGFDGYLTDYRCATTTYYLPGGDYIVLTMHADGVAVAEPFDVDAIQDSIRAAQRRAPGYTYRGFAASARRAGCAGYLVSLPGRRVVYFGRTGETHVEHFPS